MRNQEEAKIKPNLKNGKIVIYIAQVLIWYQILLLIYLIIDAYISSKSTSKFVIDFNKSKNIYELFGEYYGIVLAIFYIILMISFIIWFSLAYKNLSIKSYNTDYSWYLSILYWFVPILNLYYPYKILKDMHIKIQELLMLNEIQYEKNSQFLINLFWTFFILNFIIRKFTTSNVDNNELSYFDTNMFIQVLFSIFIPVCMILVVTEYSEYEELFENHYLNNDKLEISN